MLAAGCIVQCGAWFADFRSELLSFPAGKHDDQVDALALAGQLLDMMVPGRVPKDDKRSPRSTATSP